MPDQSSSLSDLPAVILVGGFGTRLKSIIPDQQKVLAEVNHRPFVTYLLDQLVQSGARNVVLCTGYHGLEVQKMLGGAYHQLNLRYSHEDSPLGTGGALRLALPQIASSLALVMNGDSMCEIDLVEFRAWHETHGAEGSLALTYVPDSGRFGWVETDVSGRITSFVEKSPETRSGWINAGIYLLSTNLIEQIPPGESLSLERVMFPRWIARGLMGFHSKGRFLDIGTPESYATAEAFFNISA